MMATKEQAGLAIRRRMRELGLSQPALGRLLGKSHSWVNVYLLERPAETVRKLWAKDPKELDRLLRALQWTPEEFSRETGIELPGLREEQVLRDHALPVKTHIIPAAAGERRLYPLYRLMLTLGLRVGEAMALRLEDWALDPTLGVWRLRVERTATDHGHGRKVSETTKTPASVRTIYAPADLAEELNAWLERREAEARAPGWQEEGWLIPASTGRMLLHTNIRRDFLKAVEAAGVPVIRLHDLRHTAANLMRQIGIPREVRMQILGHQVRDVHDIYAHHVEPGELVRAAQVLEGLFNAGVSRENSAAPYSTGANKADPDRGHWGQQQKTDGAETPS